MLREKQKGRRWGVQSRASLEQSNPWKTGPNPSPRQRENAASLVGAGPTCPARMPSPRLVAPAAGGSPLAEAPFLEKCPQLVETDWYGHKSPTPDLGLPPAPQLQCWKASICPPQGRQSPEPSVSRGPGSVGREILETRSLQEECRVWMEAWPEFPGGQPNGTHRQEPRGRRVGERSLPFKDTAVLGAVCGFSTLWGLRILPTRAQSGWQRTKALRLGVLGGRSTGQAEQLGNEASTFPTRELQGVSLCSDLWRRVRGTASPTKNRGDKRNNVSKSNPTGNDVQHKWTKPKVPQLWPGGHILPAAHLYK